jgi:hypothetical protein
MQAQRPVGVAMRTIGDMAKMESLSSSSGSPSYGLFSHCAVVPCRSDLPHPIDTLLGIFASHRQRISRSGLSKPLFLKKYKYSIETTPVASKWHWRRLASAVGCLVLKLDCVCRHEKMKRQLQFVNPSSTQRLTMSGG